ncbi:MAG: nucleotidyltransferase family protein [Alphaproteobacteria bacterium]
MTTAIILAGGFGTRLRSVVADRPKALAPVAGRPFLAWQLDWLSAQGVTAAVLAVHHMAEQIIAFAEAHAGPVRLAIVREAEPLGTGGAVVNAMRETGLRDEVLVINGDTDFSFAIAPVVAGHRASGALATLVAARVPDVARFGTLMLDGDRVTGFAQATGVREPGWVNAGAYLLDPAVFAEAPAGAFSIEKDFFPPLAARGALRAHIIDADQAFFDIGTPESYATFQTRRPSPP